MKIVSWDQFARDWNRPVHIFLLRHVYHSSISSLKVNKHTATLITFFLSACVHELVMWCLFKKLRGYLLFLQMCQLPVSVPHPFPMMLTSTFAHPYPIACETEPHQVATGTKDIGEPHILVGYLYGAKPPMQPVLDLVIEGCA